MKKKLFILLCIILTINITSIPVYAVTGSISMEVIEKSKERSHHHSKKIKKSKKKSKKKSNEDNTTKKDKQKNEEKGEDIPEEFIEYTKFIGKDISTLNVDTTKWDFDDFTHELWEGSFYEHKGKVSVRVGWDNKTITDFYFTLDKKDKLSDKQIKKIGSELEKIFGEDTGEGYLAYNYSGKTDYDFVLPKYVESTEESTKTKNNQNSQKTYICILEWNFDNMLAFLDSKHNTTEYGQSNTTESVVKPEPFIGMTAEEVEKSSWGKPSDINKTTTQYGTTEQWVYRSSVKNKYIYLKNGIVTAIQE